MAVEIAAILLAAGLSSRMGKPKLLLPWGRTTVLGQVVTTFAVAGVEKIVVVTGGEKEKIEGVTSELAKRFPVQVVFNPSYVQGGMLSSMQVGLSELDSQIQAALFGLGDQPQVRKKTVRRICSEFVRTGSPLVIPSYKRKRGHPWLAARPIWPEILALPISTTPRQFLNNYTGLIKYVDADESILQDLDTPEDYVRVRP